MPLDVYGICEQGERPWSWMDTFKQFFLLHFRPTGESIVPVFRIIRSRSIRYQIATGASDDTIRIWDMRAIKSLYTIPAHLSNVSEIRFFHANDLHFNYTPPDVTMGGVEEEEPDKHREIDLEKEKRMAEEEWRYRSGLFFASSGYDGFVKLWSADDWQLQRTLSTDAGKVMSVDISSDGNMIASGTYNRNFQLFAPEEKVTL